MAKESKSKAMVFETVEPIGRRLLIRKDEDKKETKGGIRLPDNIEIPTITGRVIAVSAEVENEGDNRLFVVEVENVVAVFRKT
ncbi:MAG: co-chaperone GroES [Planctomycetota bacterium]